MTFQEIKKLRKRVVVSVVFIVIAILCIAGRFVLSPILEERIDDANELAALDQNVSAALANLDNLNYAIEASGKVFLDLEENKDAYLKALGVLCDASSLNIHKMSVGDIGESVNGTANMTVALEVQGTLTDIQDFIDNLYGSEILCRVASISYRLDNNAFSWMWRFVDDQPVIDWWNISNVSDYLLDDPDSEEEEKVVLDANAFMSRGNALCYMNIQFLGTEG